MYNLKHHFFTRFSGPVLGLAMVMITAGGAGAIEFTSSPIRLVDDAARFDQQLGVQGEFDWNDNFHVVWQDTRDGNTQIYGTTIMPGTSVPLANYRTHNLFTANNLTFSRIHRSIYDINSMYVMTLNTDLAATFSFCPSSLDYTGLPAAPAVNDAVTGSSIVDAAGVTSAVMAGVSTMVYAMEYNGNIYVRAFDVSTSTWDVAETVLSPPPDYTYHHPQLCTDAADYVYVIYDRFYTMNSEYDIAVQRSQSPANVSAFEAETVISGTLTMDGFHDPDIAACGAYPADLQVAIAWVDPGMITSIWYGYESNGDWTDTTWTGSAPLQLNPDVMSTVSVQGPELVFDANNITLYAAWADDRSGPMDLHFCAIETPYTVGPDQQLTTSAEIQDRPYVAAGPTMNNVAVVYSAIDGSFPSPFALMFRADFFDDCSIPPENTGYYTSVSGVFVDYTSVIPLSPPACYRFENAYAKSGTLLLDYATTEHTGSIDMYFYDDETITSEGDDFFITFNNGNLKGVIRMLGVKNDISPTNYSYYNGVQWVASPLERNTGWHHVVISVGEGGIEMAMEEYPLSGYLAPVYSDGILTSFTSIQMEGGNAGSPYFVDDILLETNPADTAPISTPSTSTGFLIIALAVMGIWLVRRN